eukprot:SAG31_NODE_19254_length_608_cov_0.840864_1_plen_88_part_00
MITGMQEEDAEGHPKMLAYLKHYSFYSREQNRMHSEANVSTFDMFDSYLAQYEIAFRANASGVMCSCEQRTWQLIFANESSRRSCCC